MNEAGGLRARFAIQSSAEEWRDEAWPGGRVIDTTPTPPYEPESVLFRKGNAPTVRQSGGQWWGVNGWGRYREVFSRLTDADVREGVKTKGWKVFYRGEPVE